LSDRVLICCTFWPHSLVSTWNNAAAWPHYFDQLLPQEDDHPLAHNVGKEIPLWDKRVAPVFPLIILVTQGSVPRLNAIVRPVSCSAAQHSALLLVSFCGTSQHMPAFFQLTQPDCVSRADQPLLGVKGTADSKCQDSSITTAKDDQGVEQDSGDEDAPARVPWWSDRYSALGIALVASHTWHSTHGMRVWYWCERDIAELGAHLSLVQLPNVLTGDCCLQGRQDTHCRLRCSCNSFQHTRRVASNIRFDVSPEWRPCVVQCPACNPLWSWGCVADDQRHRALPARGEASWMQKV
jgi:hypothetical protein